MKRVLLFALCILSLFLISVTTQAQTEQKNNAIGIDVGGQWGNGLGLRPALNINYERRFSFHSGIETGINYLNIKVAGLENNNSLKPKNEYYHLLTLPVLYKLHTNIIDIAGGPTLNLLTGPTLNHSPSVNFQRKTGSLAFGYALSISKSIRLSECLLLVPQVGVEGNQYLKKPQGVAGVGLKYEF